MVRTARVMLAAGAGTAATILLIGAAIAFGATVAASAGGDARAMLAPGAGTAATILLIGAAIAFGATVGAGAGGDARAAPKHAEGPPPTTQDGRDIYDAACARCHEGDGTDGSPSMVSLTELSARAVLAALETGKMREQASGLTAAARRTVAEWVSGKTLEFTRLPETAYCGPRPAGDTTIWWSGWGAGLSATGYRSAAMAGLTRTDVSTLELQWAFGFPDQSQTRVQPAVIGDTIIVGGQFGHVYSLDIDSGCVLWEFAADGAVRGAVVAGIYDVGAGPGPDAATPGTGPPATVFIADFQTNVYALDATSGEPLWRTRIGRHPESTITGTSALHDGVLYVPISSMEVLVAERSNYACCSSSGELVALDALTGAEIWRHRVIEAEARVVARDADGHPTLAPSGAPVWSSPTVDATRGLVYIGSGENYTRPASDTSDAIIAIDMATGASVWTFQATAGDAWNIACLQRDGINCPDPPGDDLDFGMAPMLVAHNSGDILVAGQKSGVVYGLDPDSGSTLWSTRLGRGGVLGGIHWGMAADVARVYAPVSDRDFVATDEPARPGLYALDVTTGDIVWEAPTPDVCGDRRDCFRANSAAPVVIAGVVFAGGLDGRMRAYDTANGAILWDFDTMAEFETVNGIPGSGGALDGASPVIARGRLIVSSGYAFFGQRAGNVLLVFGRPD